MVSYLGVVIVLMCMKESCRCNELNLKLEHLLRRKDMICPEDCLHTAVHPYFDDDMECCMCLARPFWSRDKSYVNSLVITFNRKEVPAITIVTSSTEKYLQTVIHKNGNLSRIPENVCDFCAIVYMDFSYNAITHINDLSCLILLDTLILKSNKIKHVNNSLFLVLKSLRVLDLSFNIITYLEPGLLSNMNGSLAVIDLSFNRLKVLDISNVLWHKQSYFCKSNFSYNHLEKITNILNWRCSYTTELNRGGYVDLTYNNFSTFIDLSEIGFSDVILMGKVYYYSFDLRFNKWICDCRFYNLVTKSVFVLNILQSAHSHLICDSPPELKGRDVRSFRNELHLLICNISVAEKCPPRCHCFYQPTRNITVVNCRSALVSQNIPRVLPDFNNLVLDFSYNGIHDLERQIRSVMKGNGKNYFKQIKKIDLSFNRITMISENILSVLKNAEINLRGNQITNIPKYITGIYPCNIKLGAIYKTCTCEDVWIQSWLSIFNHTCYNNSIIFCKIHSKHESIAHLGKTDLGCEIEKSIIRKINIFQGVAVCLIISVFVLVMNFRTEFYILTRQVLNKKRNIFSSYTYDVYISCNDQDNQLRNWLSSFLLPLLRHNKIRVFLPYRDFLFGKLREEEIMDAVSKSRNVLIILSEECDALEQTWNFHEWKYAWINYRNDRQRNIIIVNYDMLSHNEVSDRHIKAFLRLGMFIDFTNTDKAMRNVVTTKLNTSNVIESKDKVRHRKTTVSPQDFSPNNSDIRIQILNSIS